MKPRRFTFRRVLFLAVSLLVAAGLAAPYLSAVRFGERIRGALEESLGRQVEIGDVRFNLFRGPGFSLRRVIIWDDPAAGIEPFAYVTSVEARVSLRSLWTGRLEFSSLRLAEPSVNLAKTSAGQWNFQRIVGRAADAELPEIHVRGARLNFKMGDVKSVFYFRNSDLDIVPPSGPDGAFAVEFSGEPTRTDRPTLAFGKLAGLGRWRPARGGEGRLRLDLRLERSAIGELTALIYGRDLGVHGWGSAAARVEGPLSDLKVEGTIQLDEIHRWDLMPPYAQGGPLSVRGRIDLPSQELELETVTRPDSALSVRFRATSYLAAPRWALSLLLNQLALGPVLNVARHMGVPIPENVETDGGLTGVIGFSPGGGFQGMLSVPAAVVRLPPAPPVRLEKARLLIDGRRVRLVSASVRTQRGETAEVEGEYSADGPKLVLKIAAGPLAIAQAKPEAGLLLGMARPPFLELFQGGSLGGTLRYSSGGVSPPEWSGVLHLKETSVRIQGIADPLKVDSARLELKPDRVILSNIRGRLGGAEVEADYQYVKGARRPNRWRCHIPEIDAGELERLLMPSLRRERGFLSRTFGPRRAALPRWLEERRTEGVLEIGALPVAGLRLESIRAQVFWEGPSLEVSGFSAKFRNGAVGGRLTVSLWDAEPSYELGARVQAMSWAGGRLEWDALIRMRGVGAELASSVRGEGSFNGRSLAAGPELRLNDVSGDYELAWRRGMPVLKLRDLRVATARGVFVGGGSTQADGRLRLELTNGEEEMNLGGTLTPLLLHGEQ